MRSTQDLDFRRAALSVTVALTVALALCIPVLAEPYEDEVTRLRITAPDDWTVASGEEQGDRLVLLSSPNGLASILIRQMQVKTGVNAEQLMQSYDQSAQGPRNFLGFAPETLGGIEGVVGVWTTDKGGAKSVLGVFFGVKDRLGYIVVTKTTADAYRQFSPIYDQAFATFVPGRLPNQHAQQIQQEQALTINPFPPLGFTIGTLPGWILEQPEAYSIRVRPETAQSGQQPSITIEAWDKSAYASLDAFVEDVKGLLAGTGNLQLKEPKVTPDQSLQHDGAALPTRALIADYDAEIPMRAIAYMAERRQPPIYYGIFVTAPRAAWNDQPPVMNIVISSFTLIPVEAQ